MELNGAYLIAEEKKKGWQRANNDSTLSLVSPQDNFQEVISAQFI